MNGCRHHNLVQHAAKGAPCLSITARLARIHSRTFCCAQYCFLDSSHLAPMPRSGRTASPSPSRTCSPTLLHWHRTARANALGKNLRRGKFQDGKQTAPNAHGRTVCGSGTGPSFLARKRPTASARKHNGGPRHEAQAVRPRHGTLAGPRAAWMTKAARKSASPSSSARPAGNGARPNGAGTRRRARQRGAGKRAAGNCWPR